MNAVSTTAARAADPLAFARVLARRLALPALFVAAAGYHFAQSRGHVAPTVFNDELIYEKLSQAIAAGHGLSIRGEHWFFPAPLASLVQAPVWLLSSMTDAYAAAKLLNAVVMSAAVFPAYWLARRVVRPSFALLTAAAAVATPAMFYHAYLMSEALAYPVFLVAVAVLVRAVAEPSRGAAFAVPAVCLLAVATRVQFLALPLAYLAAVAVCGRGGYRRHLLPATLTALLTATLAAVPGALGSYGESVHYDHSVGAIAHWMLATGSLLPFSLGLTIVPGAILGLGYALARPWRPVERAIAVVTVACTGLFLGQAALLSAGEANRDLERYLFYVTPLLFLAFFLYAERGGPRRLAHLGLACAGGLALSQVSLPAHTGTAFFFFDSPTLSAFARVSDLVGLTNASLLYAVAPLAMAALLWALPLRRRGAPELLAAVAIGLMVAAGTGLYATDRLVTGWAQKSFGASRPDWLDRSGLGPARYLALHNANAYVGTNLESWNRELRGYVLLGTPATDPFPASVARVATDGTLEIGGRPVATQVLVANLAGSTVGLEGHVVARPRPDLVAYRIPAGAHVRWLARGLAWDGWTGMHLHYQAWPARTTARGRYELVLSLPRGMAQRPVELSVGNGPTRTVVVVAGRPVRLALAARGPRPQPLELTVRAVSRIGSRTLGVQVHGLRYIP